MAFDPDAFLQERAAAEANALPIIPDMTIAPSHVLPCGGEWAAETMYKRKTETGTSSAATEMAPPRTSETLPGEEKIGRGD